MQTAAESACQRKTSSKSKRRVKLKTQIIYNHKWLKDNMPYNEGYKRNGIKNLL